jgi:hypothetical protein
MIETSPKINPVSQQYHVLKHQLSHHKLYGEINCKENLKIFMQHHVYAVWDFMSLIKSLQQFIAPATVPWSHPKNPRYANFINQLVLEEESDYALTNASSSTHASHFESYLLAMNEVGANIQPITEFIEVVNEQGIHVALQLPSIPEPAKEFMSFTFDVIERNKPHLITAALAYGREDLVPQLFQSLEDGLEISPTQAPNLYAYLQRHIQLDGEEHGPLAIQLLQDLCEGSAQKHAASIEVAEQALVVRLKFWDGIQSKLLH